MQDDNWVRGKDWEYKVKKNKILNADETKKEQEKREYMQETTLKKTNLYQIKSKQSYIKVKMATYRLLEGTMEQVRLEDRHTMIQNR